MDFDQAVKKRRSVRKFSNRPVQQQVVNAIIESALQAPSSMNGQPWRFIVIRSSKIKNLLADKKNEHCPPEKRDFDADFLRAAPVIIVTCVETKRSFDRGLESGILATGHLLLSAANHGLSSVYLSAYRLDKPTIAQDFRNLLKIPSGVDPVTIVPIGYPEAEPPAKSVKTPAEVIFNETYGNQ